MDPERIAFAAGQCAVLALEKSIRGPEHVAWMCDQIPIFVAAGRREKAMRWLGFVQGALWADGIVAIDELKAMNAPAGTDAPD